MARHPHTQPFLLRSAGNTCKTICHVWNLALFLPMNKDMAPDVGDVTIFVISSTLNGSGVTLIKSLPSILSNTGREH